MIAEKIVCWRAVLIASLRSREETSPWQSSTNWYRKPSAASEGSTVVFYVFSFCSIIVVCLFFWGGKKNYNLNHLRPSQPWWNSGWRNLLLVIEICQIPRLLLHPSDTHHSSFPLFLDKLIIYILCATQKSAIRTQPRQQAVSRCRPDVGWFWAETACCPGMRSQSHFSFISSQLFITSQNYLEQFRFLVQQDTTPKLKAIYYKINATL